MQSHPRPQSGVGGGEPRHRPSIHPFRQASERIVGSRTPSRAGTTVCVQLPLRDKTERSVHTFSLSRSLCLQVALLAGDLPARRGFLAGSPGKREPNLEIGRRRARRNTDANLRADG